MHLNLQGRRVKVHAQEGLFWRRRPCPQFFTDPALTFICRRDYRTAGVFWSGAVCRTNID